MNMDAFESFTPIADNVLYLPATNSPLSADVGLVRGKNYVWVYDTGSNDNSYNLINSIEGPKNCVISHFHQDHVTNLQRLSFNQVYSGSFTHKHIQTGVVVDKPIIIEDGFKVDIIPFPSCHAKGSVMLVADEQYAFLGDGIYCMEKQGKSFYNAQILKDEIQCLESINTKYFLLSHQRRFVREKADVIQKLKFLYSKRSPDSPWIEIHSWW